VTKPPILEDFQHRQGGLVHIKRELVGVPAVHQVAAVRINAAQKSEHPVVPTDTKIVGEIMAGQGGVVGFDVAA
jgi:hypothetical protein